MMMTEGNRTFTAYRILRQRSSMSDRRPADLPDSGYDTMAAAAAILDEPEAEMTSYINRAQSELWTRRPEPAVSTGLGCLQRAPARTQEQVSDGQVTTIG